MSRVLPSRGLAGMRVWCMLVTVITARWGSVLICGAEVFGQPSPHPETLTFTVVHDADGEPVEGATVSVRMWGGNIKSRQSVLKTDASGEAVLKYPQVDTAVAMWVDIEAPGLVKHFADFGHSIAPEALPVTKEIRLKAGRRVGGVVVDQAGRPVAGVRVDLTVPVTDTPKSNFVYQLFEAVTDADGKWSADGAPLETADLNIDLEHPEFIRGSSELRAGLDNHSILDSGLSISGRVTDAEGQPIRGATITIGRDRWGRLEAPAACEMDGGFRIGALEPQSTWLTAAAPGCAPQVVAVEVRAGAPRVNFALVPGKTTTIRIVDSEGRPLPNVRVVADTWQRFRTLWWDGRTDQNGEVVWSDAPDEPVEYHILLGGYVARRNDQLAPREEPHVIELQREVSVTGIVTDTNKQKVPEFKVTLGYRRPGSDRTIWETSQSTSGRNGKFEVRLTESAEALFIRIVAPDCNPWESEALTVGDGDQRVFVRLNKAE